MRLYQTVFGRQALEFAATAANDAFAEITQWVDRIERMPSTLGDYTEQDADGRELQTTVLNQIAITYWPDHLCARFTRAARHQVHPHCR